MPIILTLLTKPGCHLCETAEAAVASTIESFRRSRANQIAIEFEIKNILDDAELQKRYAEEIPVLLIDGLVHNYWRIDQDRLMAALEAAAKS